MRVSPNDLRTGLVDATYRIPVSRPGMVTTHGIVTKALRTFHTEGEQPAQDYLDTAFARSTWLTGANATKARIARASFNNYCRRANTDARTAALGDTRATVTVAGHEVAAGCDVVLLENNGYQGRLCLWGVHQPFTAVQLALLACPIVLALGEELGDDRVIGLDIWALREDTTHPVTAENARGQLASLNTLVRRLTT